MPHQPLLLDRPFPAQLVLAIVAPGRSACSPATSSASNEVGYLVLSVLGVLGGIGAGYDHLGADQGFVRGIIGGLLFGTVDPRRPLDLRPAGQGQAPRPARGCCRSSPRCSGALLGASAAPCAPAARPSGAATGGLGASCAAICSRRNATSSSSPIVGGEARRLAVPAAAGLAGDDRDVDLAVGRAQRDLLAARRRWPAARGRPRRPWCPATERRWSMTPSERLSSAPVSSKSTASARSIVSRPSSWRAHAGQRPAEQLELGERHALVQAPVDLVGLDAGLDQVGGHHVGTRAGVLVHEPAGVGDQARRRAPRRSRGWAARRARA